MIFRIMKKLFWMVIAILTVSCQESYLNAPEPQAEARTGSVQSFTIPVDKALSNLRSFLKAGNTRTDDVPEISEVFPVVLTESNTRAFDPNTPATTKDTLLYVANFTNNVGYAILSANELIPDDIIAVVDSGNLSQTCVNKALSLIENGKPVLSEYPTTGECIYTLPQYEDLQFMNPNTMDPNNVEPNDSLVGNFISKSVVFDSNMPENEKLEEYAEVFTSMYCIEYALHPLMNNEIDTGTSSLAPLPGNETPGVGEGGGEIDHSQVEYTPWETTSSVKPLLTRYAFWHQGSPFNDKAPKLFGKRLHAGCFNLAIAKILTFLRRPSTFIYKGEAVSWTCLDHYNSYTRRFNTESGNRSAALLLRGIGVGCGSLYFPEGTFTFPSKAKNFLQSCINKDVKKRGFSFERCMDMLVHQKPLIIYAIPSKWKFWNSHAWNIDGYRIDKRSKIWFKYKDGSKVILSKEDEQKKMLHCDFGWGGSCNGYYVSGVFNSYSDDNELDNEATPGNRFKYNHYIHVFVF